MIALVLGSAACLWDDVAAFRALGVEPDITVACNDAIVHWPDPLTAACSLHGNKLMGWITKRHESGFPMPDHAFTRKGEDRTQITTHFLPGQHRTGSSGMYALKIALIDLGADKAVLCGIPMDKSPHFIGGDGWHAHAVHWKGWNEALPAIKDRTRSMSGNTGALLGKPDIEWINQRRTE